MSTEARGARRAGYDVEAVRRDFPILETTVHGKPLVYLDSAASAQKPRAVIEAERSLYERYYSNIHRGVHQLSVLSTDAYEEARDDRPALPERPGEPGGDLRPRHHRGDQPRGPDLGPEEREGGRRGAHLRPRAPLEHRALADALRGEGGLAPGRPHRRHGRDRPRELERLLSPRTKIVALAHVSNALGTINPVKQMTALAHARGAVVLIDGAQGAPHLPLDVVRPRLRLLRVLGAQGLRPSGDRRPLRQGGAPRGHASLAGRRRHDPLRDLREDDLQRAALQVRGGDAQHRGDDRPRGRPRLHDGPRRRGDRRPRARAARVRDRSSCPGSPGCASSAPRGRRRGSSPSCSTASTPTTSAPSSTTRGSRSAPATTARSR